MHTIFSRKSIILSKQNRIFFITKYQYYIKKKEKQSKWKQCATCLSFDSSPTAILSRICTLHRQINVKTIQRLKIRQKFDRCGEKRCLHQLHKRPFSFVFLIPIHSFYNLKQECVRGCEQQQHCL